MRNDAIEIYVPTHLIKTFNEHPESYGHLMAVLENKMYTDVYFDDVTNCYYTITNDDDLIEYLQKNKEKGETKMKDKKKYIKIQSTLNINVTRDLGHLDMTDATANVGDKLKVQALWAKTLVRLVPGAYYYPAEIKDWKTVKALETDNIITLGAEVDELPTNLNQLELEFIESNFVKLENGKEEVARQKEALKSVETAQKAKTTPSFSEINV